jgi:hypothetical protein
VSSESVVGRYPIAVLLAVAVPLRRLKTNLRSRLFSSRRGLH